MRSGQTDIDQVAIDIELDAVSCRKLYQRPGADGYGRYR